MISNGWKSGCDTLAYNTADIEEFKINIIDFESNLSISEIVIKRENFAESELEFNGPEEFWKTVSISNSESNFFNTGKTSIERLSWSLYPYFDTSLFDPDDPFRFTVGAELLAKYKFLPSTSISGSLRQPIAGTLDDIKRDPKGRTPQCKVRLLCFTIEIFLLIYS